MFGFELINLAGSSKPSWRNVAILARMVSGLTRVQVMISRESSKLSSRKSAFLPWMLTVLMPAVLPVY
jgi:hypothetical protein